MKPWWMAMFLAGLSLTAPVLARADYHDGVDWQAARALRGGNPDLDHNGFVGPVDRARMRHEAKREAVRHHYAVKRARHYVYHEARAAQYAAVARHAAAHARAEDARAHAW
jgi:hypothetical protein